MANDKHNLYFKVLNASQHRDIVKYDEARAICEGENKTLPRSSFRVVENGHEYKSIFWLAEDEQSRKEANDEYLKDLGVSFVTASGPGGFCAILGERIMEIYPDFLFDFQDTGPLTLTTPLPSIFICEDALYDEYNHLFLDHIDQ